MDALMKGLRHSLSPKGIAILVETTHNGLPFQLFVDDILTSVFANGLNTRFDLAKQGHNPAVSYPTLRLPKSHAMATTTNTVTITIWKG